MVKTVSLTSLPTFFEGKGIILKRGPSSYPGKSKSASGNQVGQSYKKLDNLGTSLVVQWLRIRLPTQGTWVRALVREDPTCRGAAKPVHHNY